MANREEGKYRTDGKPTTDFFIRNIAHNLRYLNDEKLSEYGITNQQARLLGAIRRSLYDNVEISRRYLQDMMGLSGPSVTSLLNGLEKSGFILRFFAKEDGRAMRIQVTDKGEQLIDEMNQVFESTEARLLQGMTADEIAEFIRLLEKAYINMSPK